MAIFVVVILLWNTFQAGKTVHKDLDFSAFRSALARGLVTEVTIKDSSRITGKLKSGGEFVEGTEFTTRPCRSARARPSC
jgi:ATP-dependent Zn protease